jgi:hypothetical protein
MDVIKLPKGGTIRLFDAPPQGFKPTEAEDRELTVYGLAPRPTWDENIDETMERQISEEAEFHAANV